MIERKYKGNSKKEEPVKRAVQKCTLRVRL